MKFLIPRMASQGLQPHSHAILIQVLTLLLVLISLPVSARKPGGGRKGKQECAKLDTSIQTARLQDEFYQQKPKS